MSGVVDSVDRSVRALSSSLLERVHELAAQLAGRIQTAEEAYRQEQVVPDDDLRESCCDNLTHILMRLAGDEATGVEAARATGRRRAEQGMPLPTILRAYRIGGRYVWDTLVEHAKDSDESRDALLGAAADVWMIIDDYSVALTEAYRATMAERARRDTRVRTAMLNTLLDGHAGEGSRLWEAAAALRMPHHGSFVVVAAETPALGDEALPGVEAVLRQADVVSAWRLEAGVQVGVISLPARYPVQKVCGKLAERALGRVGVSQPYARLDRTAQAVRQARVACAAATPRSRELIRYEQHPVAALLAGVPEAGGFVAHAILGPVFALNVQDRDILLDTLRAWFDAQGSASAAAAQLHVHRNTVHYRLRRIERLIGRDLTDPKAVGEVHLALEATRILDVAHAIADGQADGAEQ
jgi:PucR C-terminal helix-turn-helix domain/GGDEF-like domain